MVRTLLRAVLALAIAAAPVVAFADSFTDASGGRSAGVQLECQNGSNIAVPCGHPANPVNAVGQASVRAASFTTPAGTTAYASFNLIANSGSAGSVIPMQLTVARIADATFIARRLRLMTTDTGFAGATVRAHLYKFSPTVTNGDHGAFLSTQSGEQCVFDVVLNRHFSDAEAGVGVPVEGAECNMEPDTGTQRVYVLLEARTAATPQGGKVWTATAEAWNN